MPDSQLALRSRASPHERCPYCHDALAEAGVGEESACGSCGTLHHEVCLAELGGCTVLGCSGSRPRPLGGVEVVRARVRERLGRFVANNTRRPQAPEVVERMAQQPWICGTCLGEFFQRACLVCGEELEPECSAIGHPCRGCGRVQIAREPVAKPWLAGLDRFDVLATLLTVVSAIVVVTVVCAFW